MFYGKDKKELPTTEGVSKMVRWGDCDNLEEATHHIVVSLKV